MVSIVITAYNVAEWIEEAVNSALGQTWNDVEVVVVEDCSTDGRTQEALRRMECQHGADGSLRVVWNKENAGAGMSRRIGIGAARGEYVLLLDGDDWLDARFVETLVNGGGNADIISGGITVWRENGDRDVTIYKARVETGLNRIKGHFMERIVFLNNKLVRRSLYEKVPYCGRRYIEDTPTIVPLLYLADRVAYVETAGYNYRMRRGSLTHEGSAVKNAVFRALCMRDLIEWAKDKPREYRDLFRRRVILDLARQVAGAGKETVQAASKAWPAEWKEFTACVAEVEELRDSIMK